MPPYPWGSDARLARDHRACTPPLEKDDEYLLLTVEGDMHRARRMVVKEDWSDAARAARAEIYEGDGA